MKIDFVIFWVDGGDEEWQKKMCHYKGSKWQKDSTRFRDWGILKYWFRAVENYAPWVNHIYFITDNQCPKWLNRNHSKITLIDHKDYIPKEYLPTFNSHTIEHNIHRIKGLSDYFVVFNDDTYINAPITPDYYFKNNLPCDATLEHIFSGKGYTQNDGWGINIIDYCNVQAINAHFNRKKVVKENKKAWLGSYLGKKYQLQAFLISLFKRSEFQHFYCPHNEKAFLKATYEEVWKVEKELLSASCTRFRENISLNNYFMRYWQLASNNFYPTKLSGKHIIPISENNIQNIHEALFDINIKSLCLNDSTFCTDDYYKKAKELIIGWFEQKFPNKSSFEL